MMELAGGGSLSDSLYKGVSAEGALGGRRTALGDVPRRVFAGRASDGRVVTYKRFLRSHEHLHELKFFSHSSFIKTGFLIRFIKNVLYSYI